MALLDQVNTSVALLDLEANELGSSDKSTGLGDALAASRGLTDLSLAMPWEHVASRRDTYNVSEALGLAITRSLKVRISHSARFQPRAA